MTEVAVAAVDLGASGGRVIAARVSPLSVELHEVSRFPNEPVSAGGTLYWDILRLHGAVVAGLRRGCERFPIASVGIDSWGCDYGLLDTAGVLIGNPVHHRDGRTDQVKPLVPVGDLYAATGIQHLPFNTIYQLAVAEGTPALAAARTLLLVPDLLGYWLGGPVGAEVTNASTTSLLEVSTRTWSTGLMEKAGIPASLFPPLRQPGDLIGPMSLGLGIVQADGEPVPLIAVASHDTASAVVAVPADGPSFAYISCGTWSLARESQEANFTNEAGVDGTVRYLRNVSGLWLLQECLRDWGTPSLAPVLADAACQEPLRFVVDVGDPVFLPPGGMPARISAWLASRGLPVPKDRAQIVRCVLDSLALAYSQAVSAAQRLSGRHADVVHVVGGGSRNDLLCQLAADACGLPVVAGPAEATALGNILVQARALGAAPGSLPEMRALVRSWLSDGSSGALRTFTPSGGRVDWAAAARRIGLE